MGIALVESASARTDTSWTETASTVCRSVRTTAVELVCVEYFAQK